MCRRWWWVSSAVATALLLLAGCTGADGSAADGGIQAIEVEDDGSEPASEADPDPATDAEPEPEDGAEAESDPEPKPGSSEAEQGASETDEHDAPFAFDDSSEIDADYVDRVMAELYPVVGDLLRDVLARDLGAALEDSDYERLAAIFTGPRLVLMGQNYQDYARDAALRAGFLPLPELGNASWTTRRVMHAEPACIVAVGNYDLSAVSRDPYDDSELTVIVLEALNDQETPQLGEENPSGWRIHEQAQMVRGEDRVPVDISEVNELDYEAGLSMPCLDFEIR